VQMPLPRVTPPFGANRRYQEAEMARSMIGSGRFPPLGRHTSGLEKQPRTRWPAPQRRFAAATTPNLRFPSTETSPALPSFASLTTSRVGAGVTGKNALLDLQLPEGFAVEWAAPAP
jgi:hypothetical protein